VGFFLTFIFDFYFLPELGILNGIRNSSAVLCCIIKKYTESKNCVREITFDDQALKPWAILMLAKLKVDGIGEIVFIIAAIIRHNLIRFYAISFFTIKE